MKTCLRCNKEKDSKSFEENDHIHEVCTRCRNFMAARLDFLIQMDEKFHEMRKYDFETTQLYLRALLDRERCAS